MKITMFIKECTSQKEWDDFILKIPHTPFHQLWDWGELEKSRGENIKRWQIFDSNKLIAQAQVIYHKMRGGFTYAYLPRGPVGKPPHHGPTAVPSHQCRGTAPPSWCGGKKFDFDLLVEKVCKYDKPIFFLCEPLLNHFNCFSSLCGASNNTNYGRLPQQTLIIDLSHSPDVLKKQMHEKCRYNIGLAERKGVDIVIDNTYINMYISDFLSLLHQTAKRNNFSIPSDSHLRALCNLRNKIQTYLALAKFDGRIIAGALLLYAGDTVTYLHGGFDYNFRHLMASNLLHWRAIEWAKRQGAHYYDFWGVAPIAWASTSDTEAGSLTSAGPSKQNEWAGITRFKLGFGGEIIEYQQAKSIVFRPFLYAVYKLLRPY
jgi:lipid II:glycine glycyltransferase (peptidoglycan interpeptide bridge formation enzyme)